jgi:NodT family efflux transporter outer membrane factor (OMF) lipoprotein
MSIERTVLALPSYRITFRHSTLCLFASLALAGCAAVGSDFKTPELPAAARASGYTAAPLPGKTVAAATDDGGAQRWVQGADIPAGWWGVFHSPALDKLIRSALQRSPTLAAAQATLRQAQESLNAQQGKLQWPQVDAQLGAQREHASAVQTQKAGGQVLTLFNAQVNVSYTVDAFGGVRRQIEGAQAQVDAQRAQVEATYLMLTGNLVTTAIKEAGLRAQLQATREVLQAQQEQLEILQKQFELGAAPKSTVLAQQTQVAQTEAGLPALEKALTQTRHQLAVYAGRLPSEPDLPEFTLADLTLPQELPLSLPSELARQRPDVRAAEALLHQASAQVGVATANLYPQIQLTANLGSTALSVSDLFSSPWSFWTLAGGLVQPLFHGDALNAQRRAAIAAFDAAAAQYQATLLVAFQNVADALRALQFDADALKAQATAEAAARQSLDLSTTQYRNGAVSYVQLLTAQQAWLQTHTAIAQTRAARFADTAALYQALGGGWWNRDPLPEAQVAK